MNSQQASSDLVYFAANAPDKPDWFIATPFSRKAATAGISTEGFSDEDKALAAAYVADGSIPSSPSSELQAYITAADAAMTQANAQEAFFQWRWFYARNMVERMVSPNGPR